MRITCKQRDDDEAKKKVHELSEKELMSERTKERMERQTQCLNWFSARIEVRIDEPSPWVQATLSPPMREQIVIYTNGERSNESQGTELKVGTHVDEHVGLSPSLRALLSSACVEGTGEGQNAPERQTK